MQVIWGRAGSPAALRGAERPLLVHDEARPRDSNSEPGPGTTKARGPPLMEQARNGLSGFRCSLEVGYWWMRGTRVRPAGRRTLQMTRMPRLKEKGLFWALVNRLFCFVEHLGGSSPSCPTACPRPVHRLQSCQNRLAPCRYDANSRWTGQARRPSRTKPFLLSAHVHYNCPIRQPAPWAVAVLPSWLVCGTPPFWPGSDGH